MNRRQSMAALRYQEADFESLDLTIQITGDVEKPGVYSLRGGSTLLSYLNEAGIEETLPPDSIIILRSFGLEKRSLVYTMEEPDRLPRPKPGDIIIVKQSPVTPKIKSRPFVIGRRTDSLTDVPTKVTSRTSLRKKRSVVVKQYIPPTAALIAFIEKPEVKHLVNRLAERQAKTSAKSFSIVSPLAQDGRTFFCASMALSYALLLDSSVLILDCSESGEEPLLKLLPDLAKQGRQTSGKSASITIKSARELTDDLASEPEFAISSFIFRNAKAFDLVLIDTTATGSETMSIDPIVAAAQSDGAVVVLPEKLMEKNSLTSLNHALKKNHIPVVGIITNKNVVRK